MQRKLFMEGPLEIGKSDTCWVFICDSNEVRHFYDIVFSVSILFAKGIPSDSIKIFTNFQLANLYLQPYSCPEVISIDNITAELSQLSDFSKAIIVVTGHGRIDGVGQQSTSLKADMLLRSVRSIPKLSCGVIILCQCFAGVFNFLDAATDPKLVIIGATNLNPSLSISISLPTPIVGNGVSLSSWLANAFMFYLFRWIERPVDIDGDGNLALVDAYKYAGAESGSQISSNKSLSFIFAQNLVADYTPYKQKMASGATLTTDEQLKVGAIIKQLEQVLSILNISQEPWILHANFARNIAFLL